MSLAKTWHMHRNPFSKHWQELICHGRPFLVELACYPDSRLSSEVEKRFGKGSAVRLSDWNGANLETPEGIEFALHAIERLRPLHLWIACECGPFCPLQHLNRRTEEQRDRLDRKRRNSMQVLSR